VIEKINLGKDAPIYPMPVALVGANVQGRPNFMTTAWVSRVNFEPAIIAAALNKLHYTTESIRDNRTYRINIPSADMIEVTDCCGIVAGRKDDKPDIQRMNPAILTMPDNRYWSLGEHLGKAWGAGKKLRKD
jgi:flavin reductase (DIM6/NTAB) family NADH-FMN oxidoreductase RutF